VANNSITDCRSGVRIIGGQIEKFDIVDNSIEPQSFGIGVVGGDIFTVCGIVDLGQPYNGFVARNNINGTGILVSQAKRVVVRENTITLGSYGVVMDGSQYVVDPDSDPLRIGTISDNSITSCVIGIAISGPTTMRASSVSGNLIEGALVGLLLEQGANGLHAVNNEFRNTVIMDIWLGGDDDGLAWPPAAYDNLIVGNDFETTYIDFGVDNEFVGTFRVLYNPQVPDHVKAKLQEIHEKQLTHP
jgi:hypothetical protein